MNPSIRKIIGKNDPRVLIGLDSALALQVINFKRDLFPALRTIDELIPGPGFQYVIWDGDSPLYPFPGWAFDGIVRPMRYIPTNLASNMKFADMARSISRDAAGHAEECLKAFCRARLPRTIRYHRMPIGKLARERAVCQGIGSDLSSQFSDYSDNFANVVKHRYQHGTPHPVIAFPDALGGYFASRILGRQALERADLLHPCIDAVRDAYSKRVVYVMPSGREQEDDTSSWPLRGNRL